MTDGSLMGAPTISMCREQGQSSMFDLFELVVGVALIGLMALYAYACQRL